MRKEVAARTLAQYGGTCVFMQPSQAKAPSVLPSMFRLVSSGGVTWPVMATTHGILCNFSERVQRWGSELSALSLSPFLMMRAESFTKMWRQSQQHRCLHVTTSWQRMTAGCLVEIKPSRGYLSTAQRKTVLLNEAINNIAMGTSVDEQMLCSPVRFHYFHALLSSVCFTSSNEQNTINTPGALRILCSAALLWIQNDDDFCNSQQCKLRLN